MTDRRKMLAYGAWLESYLNPNAVPSDFKKLASDGIKFLNVDYEISPSELTLQFFNTLYEDQNRHRCYYMAYAPGCTNGDEHYKILLNNSKIISKSPEQNQNLFHNILQQEIYNGNDPLKIIKSLIDIASSKNNIELSMLNYDKNKRSIYYGISKYAFEALFSITKIETIFRYIHDQNVNWSNIIQKNKADLKNFYNYIQGYINELFRNYGKTIDYLILENDNYKSVKRFSRSHKYYQYDKSLIFLDPNWHKLQIYPWYIVSSQIFFKFLMLGGQSHYIFCKHCDRFALAKRLKNSKPEKVFCSDVCRTANQKS